MNIYLANWLYSLSIPVVGWGLLSSSLPMTGVMIAFIAYGFLGPVALLRCPKCGSPTWTYRWERGRRGFFNQYVLPLPPMKCSYCEISFLRHNLGDHSLRQSDRRRFWID